MIKRAIGLLGVPIVAYLGLEYVLAAATESAGLVTPAAPNVGVVALGVVYLLTRAFVRAAIPAVVVLLLLRRARDSVRPPSLRRHSVG